MEPLDTVNRWLAHMRDRHRVATFLRYLWKRFLDDNLFQAAGALSYTTVFALVPLSMVVFGVLSAFPVFDRWSDQLSDYVFSNFVPSSARAVETYLRQFSLNAGQLTAAGIVALVFSLLVTLNSVETTFNRIWRVPTARPKVARFLVYWTVFTLGALVAATSLALSTRFFAMAIFETEPGQWLENTMVRLTPFTIELISFAAVFKVVPHRTVLWRHAFGGALLAALLFEGGKWSLAFFIGGFSSYGKVYGTLAFAPIFLVWIYLGWTAILLGASFAASMSAFRYQPVSMRLPPGYEFYGLLRLLGRFAQARAKGLGLHSQDIHHMEPMLTDALVQQMLSQLSSIGLVSRAESGEWLLARDLDTLTVGELYEACQLRVPIAEAHLPCRDDPLGQAAAQALDELRLPLRELLKRRVSSIYEHLE
ncbi:YihY family inner membrane protein [Lysobacter sp. KIS68-7]|uniref:YihY family inner membrane protein n=1 Tax=Lysobacter sp. KIS68-7 TaxID=2904252 RepID=UPI001E299965|nr:YihY family inner membrane protein [Lysobacter sp. KIS68-7]UHQ20969.1 YihY family inner membrane protein [Lysobacter sp. KIS68-7]